MPHLLGRGLTLFALDGENGPEIADHESDFFEEDKLHDTGLGGGFAVAQRACDLETGNVPENSNGCTRPFLFASARFWWGYRTFRVAPGLDVILNGGNHTVLGNNLEVSDPKPFMGDLAFEDPSTGDRLLIVHTTPPALSRIDTSLDEDDDPKTDVLKTTPLCNNPNILEVWRPDVGESLAFVSCYAVHEVAVIALGAFVPIATILVGAGSNELLIDAQREWLFVANTIENTISIIELDRTSPLYLREIGVVGLGSSEREPVL